MRSICLTIRWREEGDLTIKLLTESPGHVEVEGEAGDNDGSRLDRARVANDEPLARQQKVDLASDMSHAGDGVDDPHGNLVGVGQHMRILSSGSSNASAVPAPAAALLSSGIEVSSEETDEHLQAIPSSGGTGNDGGNG